MVTGRFEITEATEKFKLQPTYVGANTSPRLRQNFVEFARLLGVELPETQTELSRLRAVSKNQEAAIERLTDENDTLKYTLASLEDTCAEMERQLATKMAAMTAAKERMVALDGDYQTLRQAALANAHKVAAQQEWNTHLTAETTRLLAYEKSTKAIAQKWQSPKIWDVWTLFLNWLFPVPKSLPSSEITRRLKAEYNNKYNKKH